MRMEDRSRKSTKMVQRVMNSIWWGEIITGGYQSRYETQDSRSDDSFRILRGRQIYQSSSERSFPIPYYK